jgi:phosphoglycolate phosphatase-like HAD superfamily hydrolase
MTRGILFDLDGTLLDRDTAVRALVAAQLAATQPSLYIDVTPAGAPNVAPARSANYCLP